MNEDDIEGEEDGISRIDDDEVKITPFNMKEEMQEGHFDSDGHYLWNKDKEIKDNWLDNIDWVKIKKDSNYKEKYNAAGLPDSEAESSTDEEEDAKAKAFDLTSTYKNIIGMMKPRETVKKTLQRLGGGKKISSAERWKRKKAGIVDDSAEQIQKFTGFCDEILTRTGNMDIYEETFETIDQKIKSMQLKQAKSNPKVTQDDELDMYADDFDTKEKVRLGDQPSTSGSSGEGSSVHEEPPKENTLMWEYKISQDATEIHGPFSSEQMQKFVDDDTFKESVFVRKIQNGVTEGQFYNSARIDFELYI